MQEVADFARVPFDSNKSIEPLSSSVKTRSFTRMDKSWCINVGSKKKLGFSFVSTIYHGRKQCVMCFSFVSLSFFMY